MMPAPYLIREFRMSGDQWRWDETLFEGTAPYYVRGRLPYAAGMERALADALALDGTGRLIDVGCGPGQSPCASRTSSPRLWESIPIRGC